MAPATDDLRDDRLYLRKWKSRFSDSRERTKAGAPGQGYDRIYGALKNFGYRVSDATVANVLKRNGLPPAGDRKKETTWTEFINSHMDVLVATDFFTAEVWSRLGLRAPV